MGEAVFQTIEDFGSCLSSGCGTSAHSAGYYESEEPYSADISDIFRLNELERRQEEEKIKWRERDADWERITRSHDEYTSDVQCVPNLQPIISSLFHSVSFINFHFYHSRSFFKAIVKYHFLVLTPTCSKIPSTQAHSDYSHDYHNSDFGDNLALDDNNFKTTFLNGNNLELASNAPTYSSSMLGSGLGSVLNGNCF